MSVIYTFIQWKQRNGYISKCKHFEKFQSNSYTDLNFCVGTGRVSGSCNVCGTLHYHCCWEVIKRESESGKVNIVCVTYQWGSDVIVILLKVNNVFFLYFFINVENSTIVPEKCVMKKNRRRTQRWFFKQFKNVPYYFIYIYTS